MGWRLKISLSPKIASPQVWTPSFSEQLKRVRKEDDTLHSKEESFDKYYYFFRPTINVNKHFNLVQEKYVFIVKIC